MFLDKLSKGYKKQKDLMMFYSCKYSQKGDQEQKEARSNDTWNHKNNLLYTETNLGSF